MCLCVSVCLCVCCLMYDLILQGESINLDPELRKQCSNDIDKYCSNITPGNAAVS